MNRLRDAASPYLLQHADNPVHWREWNDAAFEEARSRDVPILLSIGYAACHWCHVMAHESFEDEATASVMNAGFVSVKVDREERPDIDQIYMNALQALGEQGGWPLTMFLDPDGRPFWGGTYFPPDPRYGRPSFVQVLEAVSKTWAEDRDRVRHNTTALTDHLQRTARPTGNAEPTIAAVDALAETILSMIDGEHGGLKGAPKFPNAPMMEVLWRAWKRTGREAYRDAFLLTTRRMALGGIYDHFGGGLHRYSVDAKWLVPHFEKMLYDQTHFIRHCAWAYTETDDELFRDRIERTVRWLAHDMRMDAGFAASLDADTPTEHGAEEGLTYTWTADEVGNVLEQGASEVITAYDLAEPNFEGRAIPNRIGHDDDPKAARHREALLTVRERRVQPARDDKVLTDWNAALVSAWFDAGTATGRCERPDEAIAIFDLLSDDAHELPHSRLTRHGSTRFVRPALLSDHAEMMLASLDAYGATGRRQYLERTREHLNEIVAYYIVDGLPVLTHDEADGQIVRPSAFQDDPNPSPASQLSRALTILDALGEPIPNGLKNRLERALASHLESARFGTAGAANALDLAMNIATLVLVDAPYEWVTRTTARGDPNLYVLPISSFDDLSTDHAARALEGSPTPVAILCRHHTCHPPARSLEELEPLLA